MPSPIGHSLAGLSIGMAYALPKGASFRDLGVSMYRRRGILLASIALANLPDIDYLPGLFAGDFNAYHHHYSHTLGWLVLVSLGIWMIWKSFNSSITFRHFSFIFIATGSHLILDFFTRNTSYPYGIMLFWPFSNEHYLSGNPLFWNPQKSDWGEVFQWYNVQVMIMDAVYTSAMIGMVLLYKRYTSPARPVI